MRIWVRRRKTEYVFYVGEKMGWGWDKMLAIVMIIMPISPMKLASPPLTGKKVPL